ncbi:MAG: hypothetical protein LBP59_12570 [Planctomycetaceae bacterium]|nr:hypothetical protein [Planctomycetaceae bacterium]
MLQKIVRRIANNLPSPPDRGRPACMRLYSTANERGLISGGYKNSFLSR